MKNKEIYESALNLLAQSSGSGDNADYEERAPYLIANFCNDVLELDAAARKLLGLPASTLSSFIVQELEDDFPLLDRFVSAAVRYLAAMLVIDEDGELSDRLFDMYCEGISRIREELPAVLENIVDKYF